MIKTDKKRQIMLSIWVTTVAAIFLCLGWASESRADTVSTSFETSPPGDFTIGTAPITATFTGGTAKTVGNFALYHSGTHSWHVSAGQTAVISFETPAREIRLFFRNAPGGGPSEVRVIDSNGAVLMSATGTQAFQQVVVNDLPAGQALIDRIEVQHSGGGLAADVVVDDVSFTAEIPLGRFADVPPGFWALTFIETLAESGITAGCGNGNFCPDSPVTRAQMAVFLERGIHGAAFSPPAATGNVFLDVGATDFAAAFVEQLSQDGITGGCGNNSYCPNDTVTRDQMAVFLLRAKHGAGFTPPPATGIFADVDLSFWAVAWIEQLAAEGITSGCGGDNYCPNDPVMRDQMAVFLVKVFSIGQAP